MTDLELKRVLSDLSNLRSDSEPIVTLYLDTRWTDEKQRERSRVFVQEASKQALDRHAAHPQREALRRTLERVGRLAAENSGQPWEGGNSGLAVFACDVARAVARPALRPALPRRAGGRRPPHLLQLARLADDAEPAIVAFVHGRGAQLYEVVLGAVVRETRVEREVPRRHGEGGRPRGGAVPSARGAAGATFYERERKNQRHVEELVERVRREAVERLRQLWEREPRAHLVLVGTSETVADFERDLPERMREKVLARLPRPPSKDARKGERPGRDRRQGGGGDRATHERRRKPSRWSTPSARRCGAGWRCSGRRTWCWP